MKTLSPALLGHLRGEVTRIRTCWKVMLANGTAYGFTNHDDDLVVDGFRYLADSGHTPSSIVSNSLLAVDNLEVAGVLDNEVISEADIRDGLWDFAQVEIFQVNTADLGQGVIRQHVGRLGEVRTGRHSFSAELRGLSQQLQQTLGELYSPTCRADFGDARCKIDLAAWTVTGSVTATPDESGARRFIDAVRTEADGHFDGGKLSWLSGDNAGLMMEVQSFAGGQFTLQLAMPYAIAPGDGYTATAGCRKRFTEDCQTRFDNALNFRGEPHVPGTDQMLQIGGVT